jgi:GntR family transcriptional regulator / MocR family aminotransferase
MWGIELQHNSEITLSRQIYSTFRSRIMDGRVKSGEALPSTRELAAQLAVSRNTVCEAYDMLLAEAFIESRQGSPTRVAQGVQLDIVRRSEILDKKSGAAASENDRPACGIKADFRTGLPDLHKFPMHQWLQLMHKASEQLSPEQWGYTGPEGLLSLRAEIAAWLFRSRGMDINPEEVFITAGATHALHLLSELLFTDSGEIIVEDPCHTGMLRALKNRGFKVIPVPVDEHGLRTGFLESLHSKAVYVTPSHQFPLGGILTAGRRTELIHYAEEHKAYIIEDDYDSEFRYVGTPVAPLHSMDPDRVIYVGTFSKIIFPSLRIGYVILPRELQSRWRYLRIHTDVQNPPFEQATLAEFMHSRRFDRHIQQMRRLYGHRRQALLQALDKEFGRMHRIWGDAAGLHLAVEFIGCDFNKSFLQKCKENGIYLQTIETHCIHKGRHTDKLLLGYGHLDPEDIQADVLLLGKIFNQPDPAVKLF